MAAAPQQCALTARLSASTSASSSSRARPTSQFAQPQRIVHLRHARGRANLSVRAQSDGSMPVQEGVAKERQKIFNNIAPVYDQLNDLLSLGLHRSWKVSCNPAARDSTKYAMMNAWANRQRVSWISLSTVGSSTAKIFSYHHAPPHFSPRKQPARHHHVERGQAWRQGARRVLRQRRHRHAACPDRRQPGRRRRA